MKTTYREELDNAVCDAPGCAHQDHDDTLVLTPRCHIGAPVRVMYKNSEGVLVVYCYACGAPVTMIAVAGKG